MWFVWISASCDLATGSLVSILRPFLSLKLICLALVIHISLSFLWAHPLSQGDLHITLQDEEKKPNHNNHQTNKATWTQQLRIKLQTLFIDLSTTVMQVTVAQECSMCCLRYDSGNTNCTEQQPSSTSHYMYKQTYCTDKTLIHFYRDSERELSHRWTENTGTPPQNAAL